MPKDQKGVEITVGAKVKIPGEFEVKSIGDGDRLLVVHNEGELSHEIECDACCVKVCKHSPPTK